MASSVYWTFVRLAPAVTEAAKAASPKRMATVITRQIHPNLNRVFAFLVAAIDEGLNSGAIDPFVGDGIISREFAQGLETILDLKRDKGSPQSLLPHILCQSRFVEADPFYGMPPDPPKPKPPHLHLVK